MTCVHSKLLGPCTDCGWTYEPEACPHEWSCNAMGPIRCTDCGVERSTIPLPKREKRRAGESQILRRIREAVGAIDGVTLWRNNTGMREPCKVCLAKMCPACALRFAQPVRFGLCEGSSDLVGLVELMLVGPTRGTGYEQATKIYRVGRFVAMEVKVPGKKPRPEQQAFLDLVASLGGYSCWVDSVADAVAHVEKARVL